MRFLFIGLALLILCVSCEEDRWYNVPDDAQEYIDAFSDYANQRGYQIDIKESGLIIEYNQLEEGVFASIFYEDPVRIEIDRTAWMSMSGYAKELLLYQYLAYGFLNRQTLNTKFPNGEWVSIMRGIPFDEYDSQVLNFQGFRKEYYINELFDSSIDSPWWADYSVTYDSLFQANNTQMLFEEDFLEDFTRKKKFNNKFDNFAVSNNGKLIVFSYQFDLFAIPAKGGEVKQITSNQTGIQDIVIMDDNQTIFFTSYFTKFFENFLHNFSCMHHCFRLLSFVLKIVIKQI